MKGLFLQDLYLLKESKRLLIIVFGIGTFMLFTNGNTTFVVSYITLILAMGGINSIAYNSADNGMAFIMTLPISRKEYVTEKYIINIIMNFTGWILAILLTAVISAIKQNPISTEDIFSYAIFLLVTIFISSLSIPILLKFGSEKGRMYMTFATFAIAAVILFGVESIDKLGVDLSIFISNLKLLAMAAVIIAVASILISIAVSMQIMRKKQF